VPFEEFGVWTKCVCFGDGKSRSVHRIVFFPVVEFLFNPPANLNRIVRRDGHVSPVKQRMKVLSEQKAVGYGVPPHLWCRA